MGSLCKPQKLTTTQNASTTALQPYAGAYQQLLQRGMDVSNTAYNPATNAGVAGFSDPQQQAFQSVQNMQGSYQPYLNAAAASAFMGTAPTYETVGNYMNPYTQNVTNALLGNYDQAINQNRQMTMSDAARAGALTGDRRFVAQNLNQQQMNRDLASALAQTQQRGYETALGAAQTDAQRQLAAAQGLGNLATQAQSLGYTDVNNLMGIGNQQQAQQQRELDTATQNALRQSAYPFETAQWASNYATGLGGAAGSSSTGKTVQPGPSYFQQILGAAAAAAGAAAKGGMADGGRIGYALGGGAPYGMTGSPYSGGLSYIPQIKAQRTSLPKPQFVTPTQRESGMSKILDSFNQAHNTMSGLGNISGKFETPISTTTDNNGWTTTTSQAGFVPWLQDKLSSAGNYVGGLFGYSHGGPVRHAYQYGGLAAVNPFDYYSSYVPDNSDIVQQEPLPEPVAPEPVQTRSTKNASNFSTFVEPMGLGGLSKDTTAEPETKNGSLFGLNISPEAADALMAAGFGMMASNSPFAGQAIGEGGLAGLSYYGRAVKAKQDREAELQKAIIQHATSGQGNLPAAIQEYEYRKKLTPEEDRRFMEGKRGDKWIDAGTYMLNSDTGEKIPKELFSAEEAKKLGEKSGEKKSDLGTVNTSFAQSVLTDRNLTNSINHAKELAGPWTTGFTGTLFSWVSGNQSSDLAIAMRNIKANLAFGALKDLKAAGGTLGAVSEKELELLTNAYGALEQAQSYPEFVNSLNNLLQIKAEMAAFRQGAYEEYVKEYGNGNVPEYVTKAMQGTLIKGTDTFNNQSSVGSSSQNLEEQKKLLQKKYKLKPAN